MKAILLDEAKKWLEENCENQYTRMAVFGIMQSMPTVDYQKTPNEPLTLEQLRQMDGEPVWVEDVKHWALIDIEKGGQWDGIPFAVWEENGAKFTYNVKSRGLQCYRRPPEGEEEEKHVIEITENL